MSLSQMQNFTFNHSDQQDAIYTQYTAQQIKSLFDSRGDELRTFVNLLVDSLNSVSTGNSGADQIKATPVAVGSGDTVQAQLSWLLSQIAVAATGSIPATSITEDKLALTLLDKINKALSNSGVLTTLLTTDKSSLVNALNEHLADYLYQTAGGTATVITLTDVVLEDGHPKTFIASANNGSVATTINNKPLYKPNTTTAPTLIAGKAYTVWYSLTGDCFFIKASAEGTATTAQVLAGVSFSNETDSGLVGIMPNNGLFNLGLGVTVPEGYYSGGTTANGKKVANGTTAAGSAANFTKLDGTAVSLYQLVVTGLDFIPSTIHAFSVNSGISYTSDYSDLSGDLYPKPIKLSMFNSNSATSATTYHIKGDVLPAQSINGGFTIPVVNTGQPYTWKAIE